MVALIVNEYDAEDDNNKLPPVGALYQSIVDPKGAVAVNVAVLP